MTDEEKDVWVERVKALGNMGVATVLVLALATNTYLEGVSRNHTMEAMAQAADKQNVFTEHRNEMIDRFVANQDKHFASIERLIQTIENKK